MEPALVVAPFAKFVLRPQGWGLNARLFTIPVLNDAVEVLFIPREDRQAALVLRIHWHARAARNDASINSVSAPTSYKRGKSSPRL